MKARKESGYMKRYVPTYGIAVCILRRKHLSEFIILECDNIIKRIGNFRNIARSVILIFVSIAKVKEILPQLFDKNHDWMLVQTFEDNTELKFAANGGWAVNWGSNTFPLGTGVQNGANIPVEVGTYRIVFNDLLGKYYFIMM